MLVNSTSGGISVGTTSEGMQRVSHMIPTPGFSNQQTLLASSQYSSGAGCLNVESNIAPRMQQQEKPFDSNQGCYQRQHLGSLVVPTVHTNILDKSLYGSSDAKMNGGIGIHRSNIQPINRTTTSKACVNLSPYGGSSCNKQLQQQFDASLPHKSPSTSPVILLETLFYNILFDDLVPRYIGKLICSDHTETFHTETSLLFVLPKE
jgi:E1A/CREB-binding protein